jgi:hypothetical protein
MWKCHNEASCIAILMKQTKMCWAPVAHTCNPCDSGGTDKEDHASKTAGENSFQDTLSKKRAGGLPQSRVPEFKPQTIDYS